MVTISKGKGGSWTHPASSADGAWPSVLVEHALQRARIRGLGQAQHQENPRLVGDQRVAPDEWIVVVRRNAAAAAAADQDDRA